MMGKSLLYSLFGLGRIPKKMRPILQQEGVVVMEEGLNGWIIFRNFRAPGRYHSYRRKYFTGSLVLTQKRLVALQWAHPVINVPRERRWLDELHCSIEGNSSFRATFDPSVFNEKWSGSIEVRFSTDKARLLLEHLQAVRD